MRCQNQTNHGNPPRLTGEQLIPETASSFAFWEHVYRYRFATQWVRNQRVLDIACGEGYGAAALLKAGATTVIGIDISEKVCAHAREKYSLTCIAADARAIPLPEQSVDVVVSFETLEHVREPSAFLDEIVRVLAPQGTAIISTPNRDVYSAGGSRNPFHCSEMDEKEFSSLLSSYFHQFSMYSQSPRSTHWWSLRSFAAFQPSWTHFKGAWRLREFARTCLCPHIAGQLDEHYRRRAADAILFRDKFWGNWLNPYRIRRRSRLSGEQPTYFIAVAQNPKRH